MVYENVTIGTELIRVVANDADSGERGSVRFTLSGSEVKSNSFYHSQDQPTSLSLHRVSCLQ